jgi:hypothetical protein
MITRIFPRNTLRVLAAGIVLAGIGCADSATAPTATRDVRSTHAARHDDMPTDPCRSGWTMENGKWVCPDI